MGTGGIVGFVAGTGSAQREGALKMSGLRGAPAGGFFWELSGRRF